MTVRLSPFSLHRGHAFEFGLKRKNISGDKRRFGIALISRQRLSFLVEVGAQFIPKNRLGDPFRHWRSSPPVVEWPGCIRRGYPSQQ